MQHEWKLRIEAGMTPNDKKHEQQENSWSMWSSDSSKFQTKVILLPQGNIIAHKWKTNFHQISVSCTEFLLATLYLW